MGTPLKPCAVCAAPVLPADVRNYALALHEAGLLRVLVGGAAYHDSSPFGRFLRLADHTLGTSWYVNSEARRIGPEFTRRVLRTVPLADLTTRVGQRVGLLRNGPVTADLAPAAVDRLASRLIRPSDGLVIGREDCALRAFRAAARFGAVRLYDLPTAHHSVARRLNDAEEARFPRSPDRRVTEAYLPVRIARKDAELAAASHVMVASKFVLSGVIAAGVPPERVTVIPYGCDPAREYLPYPNRMPVMLCVGRLSFAKGTLRLLNAWKRLGAHRTHTLRLIGKMMLPPASLEEFAGLYEYIPAVPRSQLWQHYAAAQAFVFPSACDGFGLVINEALSCGTPVIASSNTGAPGYITEGVQGFTYQHGDDDRLAAHIEWILSHPTQASEMSRAAYEFAQSWGWPQYRAAVRELVFRLLNGRTSAEAMNRRRP